VLSHPSPGTFPANREFYRVVGHFGGSDTRPPAGKRFDSRPLGPNSLHELTANLVWRTGYCGEHNKERLSLSCQLGLWPFLSSNLQGAALGKHASNRSGSQFCWPGTQTFARRHTRHTLRNGSRVSQGDTAGAADGRCALPTPLHRAAASPAFRGIRILDPRAYLARKAAAAFFREPRKRIASHKEHSKCRPLVSPASGGI